MAMHVRRRVRPGAGCMRGVACTQVRLVEMAAAQARCWATWWLHSVCAPLATFVPPRMSQHRPSKYQPHVQSATRSRAMRKDLHFNTSLCIMPLLGLCAARLVHPRLPAPQKLIVMCTRTPVAVRPLTVWLPACLPDPLCDAVRCTAAGRPALTTATVADTSGAFPHGPPRGPVGAWLTQVRCRHATGAAHP